jgi:aspartate racemase
LKRIGVVGGIGPESTIDYYRAMIAAYQEQRTDGSYPAIVITSVDAGAFLGPLMGGDHETVVNILVVELERLARAGAGCAIIAANSPHVVFDDLQRRSPLPLVSIVQATAFEALRLGRRRLGLFGTRVTMQGSFYEKVFVPGGVALAVPSEEEQAYIHDIYMRELLKGIVRQETRERLLSIVARMKSEAGIDGVILAGTELPLILRDPTASDIPLLDTTVIHARAIVAAAML